MSSKREYPKSSHQYGPLGEVDTKKKLKSKSGEGFFFTKGNYQTQTLEQDSYANGTAGAPSESGPQGQFVGDTSTLKACDYADGVGAGDKKGGGAGGSMAYGGKGRIGVMGHK